MLGNENDYLTTRVSYKLNLTGPSVNVQTACSTSLVAIAQAHQSLSLFGCDMALAGGVSVSYPQQDGYVFQEGGIGSPDGHCRPFDAKAQGTVFSNGVGIVVLKRLSDALQERNTIHAVIKGAAINNDGANKMSFAAPSIAGQADVIATAQVLADIEPETVTYVECHGTATPIGDPIEVAALTQAFREGTERKGFCALGSVKSNFGHLDSAAGVASFIKSVLAIKHAKIPPTLHFERPNPQLDLQNSPFFVPREATSWQPECGIRRAGISGFGIGGTNAHLILEQAPVVERVVRSDDEQEAVVLPISAKSSWSLQQNINNLAEFSASTATRLDDVAFTLLEGRDDFEHRAAVITESGGALSSAFEPGRRIVHKRAAANVNPVFLFPGGGSQYPGMAQGLMRRFPEVREVIARGVETLRKEHGINLETAWFGAGGEEVFEKPSLQLPAIFLVEYAVAALWRTWGVEPHALLGHSLGENAAASVAGVFGFEDALGLVALRGKLFEQVPSGGMLSVALSEHELKQFVHTDLDLATINAPEQCTVSGSSSQLQDLERRLLEQGAEFQRIPIAIAAHSRMLDPILDEFRRYLRKLELNPPTIPLLSNLTGTWLTPEQAQDPEYWVAHLRNTVQFSSCVQTLLTEGDNAFVEVGPGKILGSLTKLHDPAVAPHVVASLRHPAETIDDVEFVKKSAASLWVSGVGVDWRRLQPLPDALRIPLPTYAFRRDSYFIAPTPVQAQSESTGSVEPVFSTLTEPAVPLGTQQVTPTPNESGSKNMQSRYEYIVARLIELLAELSGSAEQDVDPAITFIDMGFDSLFLTQANLRIKKEFGVKVTFRQLFEDAPNIEALAKYIDAELPAEALQDRLQPVVDSDSTATTKASDFTATIAGSDLPPAISLANDEDPLRQAIALQIQASNALLSAMQASVPKVTPLQPTDVPTTPTVETSTGHTVGDSSRVSLHAKEAAKALQPSPSAPMESVPNALPDIALAELDAFIEAYCERTAGSKQNAEAASKLVRAYLDADYQEPFKEITYPIVLRDDTKCSSVIDIDGNKYVDLECRSGSNLLGVAINPDDNNHSAADVKAAQLICDITGMDRCCFAGNATAVITAAVRAARTSTRRDKLVVFQDEQHGLGDEMLATSIDGDQGWQTVPAVPGIPESLQKQVIVLRWDDPACMETIRANAKDIAAVLIEPVQKTSPGYRTSTRFKELREVTRDNGIALILNEVVTGFRLALGGAQEYFEIDADLVCYGMNISSGLPLAAVACRGGYLDCFDGGSWSFGDDSFPETVTTAFTDENSPHPLALASCVTTLEQLKSVGPKRYAEFNQRAREFAHRLDGILAARGFPARIEAIESILKLRFKDSNAFSRLLQWQLRHRGVLICGQNIYVSMAHSAADLDFVVKQFIAAVEALQNSAIVPACRVEGVYETQRFVAFNTAQSEIFLATDLGQSATRAFHEQIIYRFDKRADIPALRHAVQLIGYMHDGLRSTVAPEADGFIVTSASEMPLRVIDVDLTDDQSALQQLYLELLGEDFDLYQGPLVRFTLLREQTGDDTLLITAHHIVVDGWSMGVMLKDLADVYSAVTGQRTWDQLAKNQLQDFVEAEAEFRESEEFLETEAFWGEVFSGTLPEPVNLPLDRPRPWEQSYAGERQSYRFGAELSTDIRRFSQQHKCTPFTTLFTVFVRWIARTTRQRDLVIAVPMAGQAMVGMPELVGHSVSYLPLRVRTENHETFASTLERTRRLILEANDHQRYTYLDLLRKLDIKRDPSRPPLAPVSFNVDQGMESYDFGELKARYEVCPRDYVKNDMFFNIVEEADEFTLELDRNTDVFYASTMERWVNQFKEILGSILQDPMTDVDQIEFAEDEASHEALGAWNDTARDYPLRDMTLVRSFEQTVDRFATNEALRLDGVSLSYEELDLSANRIANYLVDCGVELEDRVVLILERSFDMIAAIYGVLKAGAAYVPLDAELPTARLREAIEDCGAAHVIVQRKFHHHAPGDVPVLVVDDAKAPHLSAAATRPQIKLQPSNLAYVIYTSGSTGKPKGVMVEHRAVCNRLLWGQDYFDLKPGERHVQKTPYTFDVSVPEIFWPLQVGASLVLTRPGGHKEVDYLRELLALEQINVAHFVPSMLHGFLQTDAVLQLPDLRHIYCSGEALSPVLLQICFDRLPQVKVFNLYGPTEAAVEVSSWECERTTPADSIIPLGRPTPNSTLYVLDDEMQPVPPGLLGELYIGGVQLARGYLNREALTTERFVADPFGSANDRLYRTGDIAMYRGDGVIEYHGRNDAQVKLRGYRIELGEIESVMDQLSGVISSVAAVRDVSDSDRRLIAFVKQDSTNVMTSMEMRRELAGSLPAYMIPQHFVTVDEFPYTSSGKLDRNRLLEDASTQILEARSVRKIETPAEVIVAQLWADSIRLDVEQISVDDNFFEIGGHSLLAMDVLRSVQRVFGVRLTLKDILFNSLQDFCLLLPEMERDVLEKGYAENNREREAGPSRQGIVRKMLGMLSQREQN